MSGKAAVTLVTSALTDPRLSQGDAMKIMFVDTCRSAHLFESRIANDANFNGIAFFSAVGPQQDAEEFPSLGHGSFTHALLEGLKDNSAADRNNDKAVSLRELDFFVWTTVDTLSHGRQTPRLTLPQTMIDFSSARTPCLALVGLRAGGR